MLLDSPNVHPPLKNNQIGRQKIMTDFMKRLARLKGCTPEVMSLGTGEPVAVGLCNKKLKVSKKIVFQDESSTQVKLPQ